MIRVCHAAASRTSLTKTRALTNSTYKTAREYVRIKIDGLRLVGGNPDFTNAPRHGGSDADTTESQRDMLDLTMTNAWSATTAASTRTRHRGTDELSEI